MSTEKRKLTRAERKLMEAAIARANRWETFRQTPDLPLLLISGDKDPVGAYGKGVRQVAENYRRAGLHHVECRLYPGARHEVLNEINREQVYQDVLRFLGGVPPRA